MERKKISSNAIWESVIGYSRAVIVGSHIYVSGTTATDATGNIVAQGDAYGQTLQVIKNIEFALKEAGAELSDIVRTRIYLKNMDDWEKVGRAHNKFFRDILPATTMVEVSRFISPDILVEIEAEAIIKRYNSE